MAKKAKMDADILVGGQAVLEGVMMRTPNTFAVAVRRPDGEIVFKRERVPRWTDRWPVLKLPFVRGTAILIQSLALGIRALNFSAEAALETPAPAKTDTPATVPVTVGAPAPEPAKKKGKKGEKAILAATMVFSLALAIALFVYLPYWLSALVTQATHGPAPAATAPAAPAPAAGKPAPAAAPDVVHENWLFFNVVDGAIRLAIFLAYLLLISRMKDIHRVFQYHGAEHKVVHLWEAKEELTVENARKYTTLHPRCGTSFLLFVMVVGIIVFTIFRFEALVWKILSRVLLLPLIAGISYELIRLSARFPRNFVCKAMMTPGLCLQRITTNPPTDDMLEVSLKSLQHALALEDEIKAEKAAASAA